MRASKSLLTSTWKSSSASKRSRTLPRFPQPTKTTLTAMGSVEKKNIVIVGGSLAGLLTGIPLKRQGHNVTILERTPTSLLHNQGAGIVFGDEAQSFFHQHIIPKIKKSDLTVTSPVRQTLKKNGEVEHDERYTQQMISWDLVYFVLRANFDGLRSEYCDVPERGEGEGEARYEVGRKVVGVKDLENEGVEVECEVIVQEDGNDDGDGQKSDKVTVKGDIVIAADGPSSTVRRIVCPGVERKYAGYVAWRGTVPEDEASEGLKKTFVDHFTFFHDFERGIQILAYLIPGKGGNIEPGQRLINWVWYCNYPADSEVYKDLMTDADGHHHHFTLPVGKIQPRLVEQQKHYASQVLSPQFAELVRETKTPFVQAITDVLSPRADFMDGKLLLVGDAVAGFRPHTAASTNQAAYHALLLEKVMRGEITLKEELDAVMEYARYMSEAGQRMGNRSQFSGKNRRDA